VLKSQTMELTYPESNVLKKKGGLEITIYE
jgi:hypothetical protein